MRPIKIMYRIFFSTILPTIISTKWQRYKKGAYALFQQMPLFRSMVLASNRNVNHQLRQTNR